MLTPELLVVSIPNLYQVYCTEIIANFNAPIVIPIILHVWESQHHG